LAGSAAVTGRDSVGTDVGEDGFARDLVLAFYARGSRKGAMALDELFRKDTSACFYVVDVLRVVGEELPLLLKEVNKCMGW